MRKRALLVSMLVCGTVLFGCGSKTGLEEVNIPKVETVQKEQQNKYDKTISILERYTECAEKEGFKVEYTVYDKEHPYPDGYDYDEDNSVFVDVTSDDIVDLAEYEMIYGKDERIEKCFEELTISIYDTLYGELEKSNINSRLFVQLYDGNDEHYTIASENIYLNYITYDSEKIETEQVVEQQKEETQTVQSTTPTLSKQNALKQAENYLDYMAFSRTGLIKQLEFEGYSTSDATYAVDNVKVNWNVQCAKKAESYLEVMSFSRDGLYKQLEYEGFTHEQIEYGLQSVGY